MNNFGEGVHAVGTLDFFRRFWRKPEMPEGLPPHAGALTCPVAPTYLDSLPQDFSPATIRFERMHLGARPVIAMKLALGELEVVWLADAQDPDLWMMIDFWKQMKVVPIVFGSEEQGEGDYRFFSPAMPADVLPEEKQLATPEGWDEAGLWNSMIAFSNTHGAAFPLMSARVPPLPRPVGFKRLQYLLSHRDVISKSSGD